MKSLICYLLFFVVICCYGCATSTNTMSGKSNKNKPDTIENPDQIQDLVDHLRKFPGVQINGEGRTASITVRGVSSLQQSSEPIFVLNGAILGGGLTQAYDLVQVENIRSLRVLKSPSEVAIYGIRGTNGVIEIRLKE